MTKIMCSPQTQIQNDRSLLRFQIESENTVFKFLQDGSSVRRQFFCLSVNCKHERFDKNIFAARSNVFSNPVLSTR